MTLTVWRLVTARFADSAFSGEGARLYGGRWNRKHVPMVYTAATQSLAMLELLVQDKTPANAVRQRNRRKHLGLGNLDAYSPAKLADRVKAPILLVHAKDDTVVAFEQSRLMADALEKAGKKAELITLAGEDHWLSSGDTRLKMLTETVRFLEAHNPPN